MQRRIQATSATYTTAHGNTGSITHWARPGVEPETSWFLVGFVNHCAKTGTPYSPYFHISTLIPQIGPACQIQIHISDAKHCCLKKKKKKKKSHRCVYWHLYRFTIIQWPPGPPLLPISPFPIPLRFQMVGTLFKQFSNSQPPSLLFQQTSPTFYSIPSLCSAPITNL